MSATPETPKTPFDKRSAARDDFGRALQAPPGETQSTATPSLEPAPAKPQPPAVTDEAPKAKVSAPEAAPQATVLVTELDAHIAQRMSAQPATLDKLEERYSRLTVGRSRHHRMVLPECFEELSHDCSWGDGCRYHTNGHVGKYVFRWLFKRKAAVDHAIDDLGWTLVNRAYFPSAPRFHFTASGGIEVGDAILAFMPARKALEIRGEPARRSFEQVHGRMTTVEPASGDKPEYVMMTDNPRDARFYKPDLPHESVESSETPGVMVEGREF